MGEKGFLSDGQFIPDADIITLSPLGLGHDDWPRLNAAMLTAAGKYPIQLLGGTWLAKTPGLVPSNTLLIGSPGVRIVSSMAPTGLQTNSVFFARAGTTNKTGTLNGTPVIGGVTLSYTVVTGAAPAIGNILAISSGVSEQVFIIKNVAGGGPYTVTLDHPIVFPFVNGNAASILANRPSNIKILGNGMQVSGTGDRLVEIVTGYQCHVEDIHYDTVDGAISDVCFAYDIGGQECDFERCSADLRGSGASTYGFALEANERSFINQCEVTSASLLGAALVDCFGSGIVDTVCTGPGTVFTGGCFGIGSGSALGSVDCFIEGCTSSGGVYGCVIGTATNSRVHNSSFDYAANTGIILSAAGLSKGVMLDGIAARQCNIGLNAGTANTGVQVKNLNLDASVSNVLLSASELEVDGLTAVLTVAQTSMAITGPPLAVHRFRNVTWSNTGANSVAFYNDSSGRVEIDGAVVTLPNNGFAVYGPSGGGSYVLENFQTRGSATGTVGADMTTCTLRQLGGCDFKSVGTAVALHANGYWNRGTVQLNGATPVNVAFPDIKTEDFVGISKSVAAGTPGSDPVVTVTETTGFAIVGTALDTGTYAYYIQ